MRVLVTGATGFLGRPLLSFLQGAGHEVAALVREPEGAELPDGVVAKRGDILDEKSLIAAADGAQAIIHCAGKVSRRREDAGELFQLNVQGTKNAIAAARAVRAKRFVLASTSGTIAVSKEPVVLDEDAPSPAEIISAWPYYRSKLYAERWALEQNGEGLEVVSVNPTLLLGPGDVHGSSTEDVVQYLERRVPFVPAGGLSFVDARDAAAALALALEKGRAGDRYLVGAANMTIAAFFGRLERISGVPGPRLPAPKGAVLARVGAEILERASRRLGFLPTIEPITADMSAHFFYLDASKAKRELGWEHRDPNETLRDTVDDLKARGVVWPHDAA